jgi:hypothetical protein
MTSWVSPHRALQCGAARDEPTVTCGWLESHLGTLDQRPSDVSSAGRAGRAHRVYAPRLVSASRRVVCFREAGSASACSLGWEEADHLELTPPHSLGVPLACVRGISPGEHPHSHPSYDSANAR